MTARAIHIAGYYPPPPEGDRPPVHVEILFDKEPSKARKLPSWAYNITISFKDGVSRGLSGGVEAADAHDAELRVYSKTVDLLAELLAEARAEKR